MCYMAGRGVNKDRQEARRWLEVAAEQGHERGKQMLSQLKMESPSLEAGLGSNKPGAGHKTIDNPREEITEEGKGEEDL